MGEYNYSAIFASTIGTIHSSIGLAMSHTIKDKKKLLARVSKIQGQMNGLKKMLEEDGECEAVLQQVAAVKGAVNGVMRELIKGHLVEHIAEQEDAQKREQDMQVILKVLDSYIK
jgi:DNA-binding FrmR family transcriptional regulator